MEPACGVRLVSVRRACTRVAAADGLAREFDVRATRSCAGRQALDWGETLRVTVLSTGFEFPALDKGERYDSLSAIAKAPK